MKRVIFLVSAIIIAQNLIAQYTIDLNLHHHFDGGNFVYGNQYSDDLGNLIEINRVQYYLSGIKIHHDGGQISTLNDVYVLASANITNYPLSMLNIQSMEGISFDLGVDQATNHLDPNSFPPGHPLSPQTPSMHWGWTAGYNFLVIEGMADADNDGTVDTPFQFHAVGDDNYLTSISNIETTGITSNMTIEIDVEVNIADWLRGVNLATAGISHGVSGINEQIIANTNINRVFNVATTGIDQFDQLENSVTFDYTLPYAPTIYYKFPSSHAVSVEIVDLAGKQVLQQKNLNHEGNFFINKELSYGTYIARLTSDTNESLTKKFIVRQ